MRFYDLARWSLAKRRLFVLFDYSLVSILMLLVAFRAGDLHEITLMLLLIFPEGLYSRAIMPDVRLGMDQYFPAIYPRAFRGVRILMIVSALVYFGLHRVLASIPSLRNGYFLPELYWMVMHISITLPQVTFLWSTRNEISVGE